MRIIGISCIILLVVKSCFSSPTTNLPILRPIRIAEHERTFDLQPRDSNPYSRLDLQSQGQLGYGPAGMSPNFQAERFKSASKLIPSR